MSTLKTYALAALLAACVLGIGPWLDRHTHSAADNRRDVAASQICHGQPFEWQGSVLVCFRQAPQYASRSQP